MKRAIVSLFIITIVACAGDTGQDSASDAADTAVDADSGVDAAPTDTGEDAMPPDATVDTGEDTDATADTGEDADANTDTVPSDSGDSGDVMADAVADVSDDTDAAADPDADASDVPVDVDAVTDIDADAPSYGCVASELLGDSLWPPMASLGDAESLDVEVVRTWTETVDVRTVAMQELRYTAWQIIDCEFVEVRVEAFYAVPSGLVGGAADPGVVVAHGLGGCSDPDGAARRAVSWGMPTIYYTAPGNCGSTGRGNDDPTALFDTIPDPRASWFWSHAVAGSRAITVLEALGDVDPERIGMTGYSAGSVATININGFDDRLVATVPVSGVGDWGPVAEAGGWQNALLEAAELTRESPEWGELLRTVDPINQAPTQHGAVMLVNGSQDEFFPIDATRRTFDAFPGDAHRISMIPNWDHGIYGVDLGGFGICNAFDNTELAATRVERITAFWFGHHLTDDDRFDTVPPIPTTTITDVAGFLGVAAEGDMGYTVEEVYVYVSNDRAYTFNGIRLDDRAGNVWSDIDSLLPWASFNTDNTTWFAEFRLSVDVLNLADFWVTSVPMLPAGGLTPQIRPIDPFECL